MYPNEGIIIFHCVFSNYGKRRIIASGVSSLKFKGPVQHAGQAKLSRCTTMAFVYFLIRVRASTSGRRLPDLVAFEGDTICVL